MHVHASLDTTVDAAELYSAVDSLHDYPRWLDIVTRAEPAPSEHLDPGPAWSVDLRGQFGPLRRSKRLRMVRSVHEHPERVVFVRRETDGRSHSPWTLEAEVTPISEGSRLDMDLHYGGSLWVPLLDRLLSDQIERGGARLVTMLESRS